MVLGDIILLLLLYLCFDFVFFFILYFLVVGKIRKEIVVFVIPVVRCLKEQIVCTSIRLLLYLSYFSVTNTDNSLSMSIKICSEANIVINRLWNVPWTLCVNFTLFITKTKTEEKTKKKNSWHKSTVLIGNNAKAKNNHWPNSTLYLH